MLPSSLKPLFLLLAVAAGCGETKDGPKQAVERYLSAIHANRPDLAYAMLDVKVRRRVSKNAFAKRWQATKAELLDQAKQLGQAVNKPFALTARLRYSNGVRASLVHIDGQWRLGGGVTQDTSTPKEALRAFIHAVEARDYKAVMRLVSRSMRETIEHEIEDRVGRLKKSLKQEGSPGAAAVEVTRKKARFQYDRRYKIELIKEDGEWKVLDFE